MGIKGGASLINSNSKTSKGNLEDCIPRNTRVCIDASEFIYRSLIKQCNNHVSGCLNLLEKLFRHGILPLFVFDGTPPAEKQFVTEERRKTRARAHEKLSKLNEDSKVLQKVYDTISTDSSAVTSLSSSFSEEEYNTFVAQDTELPTDETIKTKLTEHMSIIAESAERERRKTVKLSGPQIRDIMTLLDMFAIPYMALDIEADIVCAKLVKFGFVDYCISNDVDLLAFGCTKIIRNMKFRDDEIEVFDYNQIINDMGLSHEQFIDLCIILGCDYAPRIIGIKSELAFALIKKYKCIETILENFDTINSDIDAIEPGRFIKLPENFTYQRARNIFNDHEQKVTCALLEQEFMVHNFDSIGTTCQQIKYDTKNTAYNKIFTYCRETCPCLNGALIHKKINAILDFYAKATPQKQTCHPDIHKDIQLKTQRQISSPPVKAKKIRSFP